MTLIEEIENEVDLRVSKRIAEYVVRLLSSDDLFGEKPPWSERDADLVYSYMSALSHYVFYKRKHRIVTRVGIEKDIEDQYLYAYYNYKSLKNEYRQELLDLGYLPEEIKRMNKECEQTPIDTKFNETFVQMGMNKN